MVHSLQACIGLQREGERRRERGDGERKREGGGGRRMMDKDKENGRSTPGRSGSYKKISWSVLDRAYVDYGCHSLSFVSTTVCHLSSSYGMVSNSDWCVVPQCQQCP